MKPNRWLRLLSFTLGFGFLYLPLLTLVVFSFNDSDMAIKWNGFSLRWYRELFHDDVLLSAAWLSLRVAAMTATMAVIVGTWIGYVLARMRRFPGISLFMAMVSAPLVIPEVILGISLLLMFVEMQGLTGFPAEQGIFTIWIGHVVLATAYVTVIIQSRLREFDRSLEEAALDLGATPLTVFFRITLPLIAPALAAAWLLSFTLSLDDVVIASFLSGPGSTLLSPEIFSRVRLGLKPEVNALATLFILAVGLCVLLAYRLQRRKEAAA